MGHVRIQRGGQGVQTPLKNNKNIGFLSNTGLGPLKITKLPSQHSMLGHHWHASKTPFKWRFAGGQMMARLFRSSLPSSTKPPPQKNPKKPKKKNIKVGPS